MEAIDFNKSKYSPHGIVPSLVKSDSLVLDVGCNTGFIGRYLKEKKNCVCDGVDIYKAGLLVAKPFYRKLYHMDLDSHEKIAAIKSKYDSILLIDLLEHLKDPENVLSAFVRNNLAKKGTIIICLPNIARLEFRLFHLIGKFDYRGGVMDRKHLHFYTYKTAKELIEKCGLKTIRVEPTGMGARVRILPKLLSFQFIFVCRKK